MSRKKAQLKQQAQTIELKDSTRMVPTSEDWAPSFFFDLKPDEYADRTRRDGFVRVRMFLQVSSTKQYWLRVLAWGNDDTGMCRDFFTDNSEEADREWARWAKWLSEQSLITFDGLRLVGFKFD